MRVDVVEEIARRLLDARRGGTRILAPAELAPLAPAEISAIQDAVAAAVGPVGGWKVGAPAPGAEPICAPLPEPLMFKSPAAVPADRFGLLGVEAEIAFRVGTDLPPRGSPYSREEVIAALAHADAAIEIVDSRWQGWPAIDRSWQAADLQSHGGFVHGTGRADWHEIDLAIQPVRLEIDGRIAAENIGGNAAGDLLRLVAWLANHLAARGVGLRAGQIVTTGSYTGMNFARPGSTVRALFRDIGEAELTFTR